jgi:hypothetical protein
MATILEGVLPKSSVPVFLWTNGINANDIHKELFHVFCGKYLFIKAVQK